MVREQRLWILSKFGNRLAVRYRPVSANKLVIMCHGLISNKDHQSITGTVEELANYNFSTVRFDFSGWGESEGRKCISVMQFVQDIESVVGYFSGYREIILIGASFSALACAIAVTRLPQVTYLVGINGFYGFSPKYLVLKLVYWWLFTWEKIKKEWHEEVQLVKQYFDPTRIQIPVMVLYSPKDAMLDYKDSLIFYEKLTTKKKLAVLAKADHEVTGKEDRLVALDEFLRWRRECGMGT